jgi:hypothetical protein
MTRSEDRVSLVLPSSGWESCRDRLAATSWHSCTRLPSTHVSTHITSEAADLPPTNCVVGRVYFDEFGESAGAGGLLGEELRGLREIVHVLRVDLARQEGNSERY